MKFKYLNLKKSRIINTNPEKKNLQIPGRRKFVKAMGLGTIAWNPLIDSLRSFSKDSFSIKVYPNGFRILRNNKLVWELTEKYFEPVYNFYSEHNEDSYYFRVTNLKFIQTNFKFSLETQIYFENGFWQYKLKIPEFEIVSQGDLTAWINGIKTANGKSFNSFNIVQLNQNDSLKIKGNCKIQLNHNWKFIIHSENGILLQNNTGDFISEKLIIEPINITHKQFLNHSIKSGTLVRLPEFKAWGEFLSKIKTQNGLKLLSANNYPELTIALGKTKNKKTTKILWSIQNKGAFYINTKPFSDINFELENSFYFAEYLNESEPNTYFSASLPSNGLWISNKLGSFNFEKDYLLPDFEAFGYDGQFKEMIFEPRLRAFKPNVEGAVVLNSVYQDPQKLRIIQTKKEATKKLSNIKKSSTQENTNKPDRQKPLTKKSRKIIPIGKTATGRKPQDPIKKIAIPPNSQRPIRPLKKNQPNISIHFNKLKFKPKKAISIKVLRPEDLLLLDFVFYNFNFTNQGQSPYLELDNKKNAGIIVIYFQSQHTLEEAYFESTPIPDPEGGSNKNIQLPAKHLRARKSRLVYELPAGHEGFPLIMSELLDWSKFKLRTHPRAWIKLPLIKKIQKPLRVKHDKKETSSPNKNLKYIETQTTEYGIKLAQNTNRKANNIAIYKEDEVAKVLPFQIANSIKTNFNPKSIKKVNWKVEPIPELITSIEAPALMYISPNQTNDFHHKILAELRDVKELKINTPAINTQLRVLDPLSTNKGEIAELWHTRLGVKLKNRKTTCTALQNLKTIRALWAHDANSDYKVAKERNYPFMASLDANNRQKLVHTTSNYLEGFEPIPVPVKNLMLTSLGAYLDWHVFFDIPTPQDNYLNIIEWEHIATLGRDHFVKIVEEGYLFPFGHRAAVVKITERKFHQQTKSAINRQRMFIVVLEKEIIYSRNDPDGNFIEFPFQEIRIETNATPNIDNPEDTTLINVPAAKKLSRLAKIRTNSASGNTLYNFYINVGGERFPFDIVATDKEGNEHSFRIPLAFMENRIARDKLLMEGVINKYRGNQSNSFNKKYNESDFNGQEVAFAQYLVDGDTAFETEMVKFDAQIYATDDEGDLKFHPKIKEAKVFVKQVYELTGIRKPATIGLEDDDNKGGVFARIISNSVVDFSGGSDKSGGFMVPNMSVSGLSKLQGPVSGNLNNIKDLQFIPDDFFKAIEELPVARIFGVIEIFSLLFGKSDSPFNLSGSFDSIIELVSSIREEIDDIKNKILYLENLAQETGQFVDEQINNLQQTLKDKVNELLSALNNSIPRIPNLKSYLTEEAFYAEYKWQPQLDGETIQVIPNLLNVKVDNPSNALTINTIFEKPFDTNKPATMNGVARFEKFGIDIIPLLAVNFNYLEFITGSSKKTDVKVDIDKNNPIEFKGVLNFVNSLQSIIPSDGFSDSGPYINIKPTGVTAGFDIAIPNVEVGICMISNISLGANVTLPFTGAPLTMGFNFCQRENPFLLTVSCFGGGGYFMMVTTLNGIQSIEAAFEFGAAMSLNVGVASGGVSAMGGFYFKMEIIEGEKTTTLTGYLRLNGHLSILGLISLSLEFYLAFSAVIIEGKVQKLEGLATLKVKVEVLFFSKTVSVTVRRELKGADADPKFIEMIDQDDWQEYCIAFAS